MKIAFYTLWKNGVIICSCIPCNKCRKERGCELLDFILDNSFSANKCMSHTSYTRHKGAMSQRR